MKRSFASTTSTTLTSTASADSSPAKDRKFALRSDTINLLSMLFGGTVTTTTTTTTTSSSSSSSSSSQSAVVIEEVDDQGQPVSSLSSSSGDRTTTTTTTTKTSVMLAGAPSSLLQTMLQDEGFRGALRPMTTSSSSPSSSSSMALQVHTGAHNNSAALAVSSSSSAYRMSRDNYIDPKTKLFRFCIHCASAMSTTPREVSCESVRYWRKLQEFYPDETFRSYANLQYEVSRCRSCFTHFREVALERTRGRPAKNGCSTKEKPHFPSLLPSFPEWNPETSPAQLRQTTSTALIARPSASATSSTQPSSPSSSLLLLPELPTAPPSHSPMFFDDFGICL